MPSAQVARADDVRMVIDWPVIDDLNSTPLRRGAPGSTTESDRERRLGRGLVLD